MGMNDMMFILASQEEQVTYTPFNMSPSPTTNCSNTSWTLRFHDGSNTYPVPGDYIYTDNQGTAYTSGGGQTFMSANLAVADKATISVQSSGLVTSRTPCF